VLRTVPTMFSGEVSNLETSELIAVPLVSSNVK